MPIILDKENIQLDALGNHSHVAIETATTAGAALSMPNDKHFVIILCKNTLNFNLFMPNIRQGKYPIRRTRGSYPCCHWHHDHNRRCTIYMPNGKHFVIIYCVKYLKTVALARVLF